jgi:hypothetical protein
MSEYLLKHKGLPKEYFNAIDWDANGEALESAPILFALWLTKHVSGFYGIGKMMQRWGYWEDSKCISCGAPVEDTGHLYSCPHESRVDAWDEAVEGLEAWMIAVETDPEIRYCIIETLRRRSPTASFASQASPVSPEILQVAQEQDAIGWVNFLEGRISKRWRIIQARYYQANRSRRLAKSWAADLVLNLYTLVHRQWKARNDAVHERDEKGMKLRDAMELEDAIDEQFEEGMVGLRPQDQHYITRGRDAVDKLSAAHQQLWLRGVRIAREFFENEVETEVTRMRDTMFRWLRSNQN